MASSIAFKARVAPAQTRRVAAAAAARPLWLPGGTAPAHLDGTLAGDYGFDPANLGADPKALKWYTHAEIIHGRWAMLGAAGVVGTSILHAAGANVPEWYDAGKVSTENTGIPLSSLLVVQMILMHFVEIKRLEDFKKPGSQAEPGSFWGFENAFKGTGDPSYPGGAFDPLGLAGPDAAPAVVKAMKEREIKNGRLAMLACLGFAAQHGAQADGPIANLVAHLSNPPANCFATNGVSIPSLADLPKAVSPSAY